jgi:hypothetical protein
VLVLTLIFNEKILIIEVSKDGYQNGHFEITENPYENTK